MGILTNLFGLYEGYKDFQQKQDKDKLNNAMSLLTADQSINPGQESTANPEVLKRLKAAGLSSGAGGQGQPPGAAPPQPGAGQPQQPQNPVMKMLHGLTGGGQQQPQPGQAQPVPQQVNYPTDPNYMLNAQTGEFKKGPNLPANAKVHAVTGGTLKDTKTYVSPDGGKTVEAGFDSTGRLVVVDGSGQTTNRIPEGYTTSGVYEANENRKQRSADKDASLAQQRQIHDDNNALRADQIAAGGKPSFGERAAMKKALKEHPEWNGNIPDEALPGVINTAAADKKGAVTTAGAQATKAVQMALSPADEKIAQEVADGKMSPSQMSRRSNNYNATLAKAFDLNPNLDAKLSDAEKSLLSNGAFRQRGQILEVVPELAANVVKAGDKLRYSKAQFIGKGEKWWSGQTNDKDYTDYMAQRADILQTLSQVMRGAAATDESVKMEQEAMKPTLDPEALEGWLQGQLTSAKPRIMQYERATGGRDRPPDATEATHGPAQATGGTGKTGGGGEQADKKIKRTGTDPNGRKVVQYEDGTSEYAD